MSFLLLCIVFFTIYDCIILFNQSLLKPPNPQIFFLRKNLLNLFNVFCVFGKESDCPEMEDYGWHCGNDILPCFGKNYLCGQKKIKQIQGNMEHFVIGD